MQNKSGNDRKIKSLSFVLLVAASLLIGACVLSKGGDRKYYSVAEEQYLLGWMVHNVDDLSPTTLSYSPQELAVYEYSYNYPAGTPIDYTNLQSWVSPFANMVSTPIIRLAVPQDRTYYVKAPELPEGQLYTQSGLSYARGWSFYNQMHINYIRSTDEDAQFIFDMKHEEHYKSEDVFNAIKPVAGQNEHIYFGTAPYTPASVIVYPTENKAPIGYLDDITPAGVVRGWAYDPNWPDESIDVHIYIDKPAGSGVAAGATYAKLPRPDVNNAYGIESAHGFEFVVPSEYRNDLPHDVYVYGIDLDDRSGASNAQLGGVPKKFTLSPASTVSNLTSSPIGLHMYPKIRLNAELLRGFDGKSYLKRPASIRITDGEGNKKEYELAKSTYRVYFNNNLVKEGNLIGPDINENPVWDHKALQFPINKTGNYEVQIYIPSGYPVFSNVVVDSKFNYQNQNKPIALPILKHIEFQPRFKANERIPVKVEFENDASVNRVELYYVTDTMQAKAFFSNAKSSELMIQDSNAKSIQIEIIAYTNDGSTSYLISPISLKSVDVLCRHFLDNDPKTGNFIHGRCYDQNGKSLPGLKVEFFSQGTLLGATISDENGRYQFPISSDIRTIEVKTKGTGIYGPSEITSVLLNSMPADFYAG